MKRAGTNYGGQALIEGVMMLDRGKAVVAVRNPQGEIILREKHLPQPLRVASLPFVRGCYSLWSSLKLGLWALLLSAQVATPEEEGLSKGETAITMVIAVFLAVGLFVVVPVWLGVVIGKSLPSVWINLIEGAIRLIFLFGYIYGISRIKEIRRVFQYHGAEHKVINAWENGEPLESEAVRKYSTVHKRCGTSFLFLVVISSIILFSILGNGDLVYRVLSRLLLLPLVAGLGYEILKLSSLYSGSILFRAISAPGLWLQKLTTREPDAAQLEVALAALKALLPPGAVRNHRMPEAGGSRIRG